MNRNLATISIDPLALVGLGTTTLSAGPLSASLTTIAYEITAALAVNQTVTSEIVNYPIKMEFTHPVTDAPVVVTPIVNGLARTATSELVYIPTPGSFLTILPPANYNHQIVVDASIHEFSNDIGLDVGITGELTILEGSVSAPVLGSKGFDPLYTTSNALLEAQDLGSVYENTFTVQADKFATLGEFSIGPTTDVSVQITSRPADTIDYSDVNLHPPIDHTIRIRNNGPTTATGVKFAGKIPIHNQFSNRSTPGYSSDNHHVVYRIGDLAPGEFKDITFATNLKPGTASTLTTSFSVTLDQPDSNPKNNYLTSSHQLLGPSIFDVSTEAELRDAVDQVNSAPDTPYVPIIRVASQVSNGGPLVLTGFSIVVEKSVVITSSGDRAWIQKSGSSGVFSFVGNGQDFLLEYLVLSGGNKAFGGALKHFGNSIAAASPGIIPATDITFATVREFASYESVDEEESEYGDNLFEVS